VIVQLISQFLRNPAKYGMLPENGNTIFITILLENTDEFSREFLCFAEDKKRTLKFIEIFHL
jgi:hypothetical protein